jgi:integrase
MSGRKRSRSQEIKRARISSKVQWKPWRRICKAAGLDDVRLHDLRHSFASVGAGAEMGLPMIGKLLGHSQPQTTARYAHLDQDP